MPFDAYEMFNLRGTSKNTMERVVSYELDEGAQIFEGQVAGGSSSQIYITEAERAALQARGAMRIISQEPLPFSSLNPGAPPPGSVLH